MKMTINLNPVSLTQFIIVYNEAIEDINQAVIETACITTDKLIDTIKMLGIKYNINDYSMYGPISYSAKFKSDLLESFILSNYTNVNVELFDN